MKINKKTICVSIIFMMLFSSLTLASVSGEISANEEITFTYNFKYGWNLITLPLDTTNNSFTYLFGDLVNQELMLNWLYYWNASSQVYENTEELIPGYGYWVFVFDNISHNITGNQITEALNVYIDVPDNMIGWVHDSPTTAEHICQAIPGCEFVNKHVGPQTDNLGDSEYITHYAGEPENNFIIEKGEAVWIRTSESSIWNGSVYPNLNPISDAGGPYEGLVGEVIVFDGTQSFDLDGEIVEYYWTFSQIGTIGPSEFMGDNATIEYSFDTKGIYIVTLKVTDDYGAEAINSTTVTISEDIRVNISLKKFSIAKIVATVDNIGSSVIDTFDWSISAVGGFFSLINVSASGSIDNLEPGISQNVETKRRSVIRRLGPVNVTVTITIDQEIFEENFNGFVIGRFFIDLTK